MHKVSYAILLLDLGGVLIFRPLSRPWVARHAIGNYKDWAITALFTHSRIKSRMIPGAWSGPSGNYSVTAVQKPSWRPAVWPWSSGLVKQKLFSFPVLSDIIIPSVSDEPLCRLYHGKGSPPPGPPTNSHFLPCCFNVWTLRKHSQTTSFV